MAGPFTFITVFLVYIITQVAGQCSGTPTLIQATVTPSAFHQPGYPVSYTNNVNCTWLVDSGVTGQPVLLYSNDFYITCSSGDYLHIYDGSTVFDTPLITNLCLNSAHTADYVSSDRYVLVQFVSDSTSVTGGFEMTHVSAPDTSGTGCSTPTNITASSTPGYLTSEGFPHKYLSSSSCRWLITAPGELSRIHVQLEFVQIEYDSECSYDVLYIYDGSYICEHKVMFQVCPSRTDVITVSRTQPSYSSTSNSLLVIFTSDTHDNYHGFVLRYNATIEYTTTTATTTTVTQQTDSIRGSAGVSSQQKSENETNIPLIIVSGVSGGLLVIMVMLTYNMVRYLIHRKQHKKGVVRVQAIAPIPARTQLRTPRPNANPLSFV